MHKKLIFTLAFFLISQTCFADTCPSVSEIKSQSFTKGWRAYDVDDGKPIPSARIKELAQHIDQFALAEWANTGSGEGVIHCYYRDKHGSNLEAYFSNDHFKPINKTDVWYEVSGFMHCAAGMDKCAFQSNLVPEQQLAKK